MERREQRKEYKKRGSRSRQSSKGSFAAEILNYDMLLVVQCDFNLVVVLGRGLPGREGGREG